MMRCAKQEGSITRDFFVRPEMKDFFKAGRETDMNEQLHEPTGRGQTFDDPLYFLQQAFSLLGDEAVVL